MDKLGREQGSNVVLKDIWIDKDRMREGVILAQLYDEAKGNNKDLMQKYFLTAICHGDVRSDPDIFDDTELGHASVEHHRQIFCSGAEERIELSNRYFVQKPLWDRTLRIIGSENMQTRHIIALREEHRHRLCTSVS